MEIKLASKMNITCADCSTEISCNVLSDFVSEFKCPVCGNSLQEPFNRALKAAMEYNKAAMNLIECQRDTGIKFGG